MRRSSNGSLLSMFMAVGMACSCELPPPQHLGDTVIIDISLPITGGFIYQLYDNTYTTDRLQANSLL